LVVDRQAQAQFIVLGIDPVECGTATVELIGAEIPQPRRKAMVCV
jgi:hypothetical protein